MRFKYQNHFYSSKTFNKKHWLYTPDGVLWVMSSSTRLKFFYFKRHINISFANDFEQILCCAGKLSKTDATSYLMYTQAHAQISAKRAET